MTLTEVCTRRGARSLLRANPFLADTAAKTPGQQFRIGCTIPPVETLSRATVVARLGHALSDPTRAGLLLMLREAPGYPAELAEQLGVSRQSLSNHLACLRGCGLVVVELEGRRARYELAGRRLAVALDHLLGVAAAVDDSCPMDATGACR